MCIYIFTTQCPAYIKRTISGRMEDSWSKPYEVFPPPALVNPPFFIWRTMVVRYKYLYFIPNFIVEESNNNGDNPMYFSKFHI